MRGNKRTRVPKDEGQNDREIGGSGERLEKEKSLYEVIGTDLSFCILY